MDEPIKMLNILSKEDFDIEVNGLFHFDNSYLHVFKVVEFEAEHYKSLFIPEQKDGEEPIVYGEGKLIADTSHKLITIDNTKYDSGFHFFKLRRDAIRFAKLTKEATTARIPIGIIECLVQKEWITAIGTQEYIGDSIPYPKTYIANKIIFPTCTIGEPISIIEGIFYSHVKPTIPENEG